MLVASERKHGAGRDRGGRSPSRTTPPATHRRYRAGPNAGRSDGPGRRVAGGAPRGCWYQGGISLRELPRRRPMAISLDRFENPVILFGPVLRHHAGGGLRAPRPPSRRWARQPFLRTDHPHLNLDLLALGHAQVFVEFDGLAVDFSVQCLGHGGFLLIVLRGFGPLSPGFGLFISTTADTDPIVVLGFDLLLVGQVRKIQAALFIDRQLSGPRWAWRFTPKATPGVAHQSGRAKGTRSSPAAGTPPCPPIARAEEPP